MNKIITKNDKIINSYSSSSILFVLVGLIMIIMPGLITSSFGLVVGVFCILLGVSRILIFSKDNNEKFQLVFGILVFLIGVFLLANPKFISGIIPTVAGVVIILNAINKLSVIFNSRMVKTSYWISDLIVAIVLLCLGLIFVIHPIGTGETIIRVLGVILLIEGLYDILVIAHNRKK